MLYMRCQASEYFRLLGIIGNTYELSTLIKHVAHNGPMILYNDTYVIARDYHVYEQLYYGHQYARTQIITWHSSILTLFGGRIVREIYRHHNRYSDVETQFITNQVLEHVPCIDLFKNARHTLEYPTAQRIAIFCEPLCVIHNIWRRILYYHTIN